MKLDQIKPWSEQGRDFAAGGKNKIGAELFKNFQINNKIYLANKVSLFEGDITLLEIDAVVNAANNSLLGGGGIDGAINEAAGPFLQEENKSHGGCPDGTAVISGGFRLPARYVIREGFNKKKGNFPKIRGTNKIRATPKIRVTP